MQIWNAMNLQQRSGLAGAMGRGAQLSLFGGAADAHGDPGPATRRSWEVFQSEGHPKMQEKTCGICRVKSCSNPSLVSSDDGKKALVSCSSLLFMALHLHKFIKIQQRCCAWFLLAVAVNCCGARLLWLILWVVSSFDPRWWVLIQKTISENSGNVRKRQQFWLNGWLFSLFSSSLFMVPRLFIFSSSTQLSLRWFRLWERSAFFLRGEPPSALDRHRRKLTALSFLLNDDRGKVPTTALWWLLAQQCGAWWSIPRGQGADHVEVLFSSDGKIVTRKMTP